MAHLSLPGALRFMVRMMLTPAPDLDAFEVERGFPKLTNPLLAHENSAWTSDAHAQRLHLLRPLNQRKTT